MSAPALHHHIQERFYSRLVTEHTSSSKHALRHSIAYQEDNVFGDLGLGKRKNGPVRLGDGAGIVLQTNDIVSWVVESNVAVTKKAESIREMGKLRLSIAKWRAHSLERTLTTTGVLAFLA